MLWTYSRLQNAFKTATEYELAEPEYFHNCCVGLTATEDSLNDPEHV